MANKLLKDIVVSDLLNKYILIQGDKSASQDVYTFDIKNKVVTFVENTELASAETEDGVTNVYDVYALDLADFTGTASTDIKKGDLIVRLKKNSDATKNIVLEAIRTDIDNTYNIPVRMNDAFHAIQQFHYFGEEGKVLLGAVQDFAQSEHCIVNFDPSVVLYDADELVKGLTDGVTWSVQLTQQVDSQPSGSTASTTEDTSKAETTDTATSK